MCYTRRKIEGGDGALWESDDANFLNPNGQSRNLNIYERNTDRPIPQTNEMIGHKYILISFFAQIIFGFINQTWVN